MPNLTQTSTDSTNLPARGALPHTLWNHLGNDIGAIMAAAAPVYYSSNGSALSAPETTPALNGSGITLPSGGFKVVSGQIQVTVGSWGVPVNSGNILPFETTNYIVVATQEGDGDVWVAMAGPNTASSFYVALQAVSGYSLYTHYVNFIAIGI